MTGVIVSHHFNTRFGRDFAAAARNAGLNIELLVLPEDPEARIADADAARAQVAYFSGDVFPKFGKQFFSATRKATDLKWMQVFNAGVDHPVFATVIERDVKGLYRKALAGDIPNFTGIDSPYEAPANPDIRLRTNEIGVDASVSMIVQYLIDNRYVS